MKGAIIIMIMIMMVIMTGRKVEGQCTMKYPEICWENLDLTAYANRPTLIRHTMAWMGTTGLIIYGGLNPGTNDLNNNVYFIQVGLPPTPGAAWTVVGITTLCDQTQTCATQHLDLKPRMDHSMVYKQDADNSHTIVIYGGLSNVRQRDCWKYRVTTSPNAAQGPNTGVWRQMNDLSGAGVSVGYRYGHTATMIQHPTDIASRNAYGRMMLFGGTNQINAQTSDLYEFWSEPSLAGNNGQWTTTATPLTVPGTAPTPVSQHCGASVHAFCVYYYGGLIQLAPLTSTNQLVELCRADPANATWVNPRPLGWTTYTTTYTTSISPVGPMSRYGHQCTKAGNRLLASGGRPNIPQPNYGSDMIDFDPVLNIWGLVVRNVMYPNDPGTGPAARSEHASGFFTFNDEYYQFYHGGQSSTTNHRDLFVHNYRRWECDGGYYSFDGTMVCLPCPAGSTSPNASYVCTNCTAGEYTDGAGQPLCKQCPLGTFLIGRSGISSSDCTNCPAGTYSDILGRNHTCDLCPTGTFSTNTTGRPFCFKCPGGTYNDYQGSILENDCRNCSARYYAYPGSANCTICPAGTYAPNIRTTNCSICLAGTWSDDGEITCHDCPIGTSNEVNGSAHLSSCVACRAGTYAPAPATPQCILCDAGYYSTAVGATSSATCQVCPIGRFNPQPGGSALSNCSFCPTGTFQNTTASTFCYQCPKGKYNPAIGSTSIAACLDCPAGTYNPSLGGGTIASCLPCPPGHYQPVPGRVDCLKCPNGTYFNSTGASSRDICTPCEPDTYSEMGQGVCTPCPSTSGNTTRSHFSFYGWEQCQSCATEETSFGFVKNGHFTGDPVHNYWQAGLQESGCTASQISGVLRMESTGNSGRCTYTQTIPLYSHSTYPYHIEAKATASIISTGSTPLITAVWNMTLMNGTSYQHTLNFGATAYTDKVLSYDFTPIQVTSKDLLDHLHIVKQATITLSFLRVRGSVEWDNVKFSPFSKHMCNCTSVLREAEYFNIDLFNRQVCDRCIIGKFCNGAGHFQCPDDTYSYGGFNFCRDCTKGLECVNGIASTCLLTQFKNETAKKCQDCPLDSACRNTDRHICEPGTYGQGTTHCINCPRGTYCNQVGCTSCTTCADGQTSNYLRTSCFDCPPGHYSTGGEPCQSCGWGSYQPNFGQASCITCPGGTNTTCLAAKHVDECL